jgi:hypothetical protein
MIGIALVSMLMTGCHNADTDLSAVETEGDLPVATVETETPAVTEEDDAFSIASLAMQEGVVYEAVVFINDFDAESRELFFNAVEWIDSRERAEAVGIDFDNDMPGGFYIYDEKVIEESLPVSEALSYYTLNESTPMKAAEQVLWEFVDYMKTEGFNYPFRIRILNGEITQIDQMYLP